MSIALRLYLAVFSGGVTSIVFMTLVSNSNDGWPEVPGYLLCGALFVIGVLLPWLRREDFTLFRAAGLVCVCSVSFYAAVHTASNYGTTRWGPELEQYIMASLVGTAIVIAFAPPLMKQPWSFRLLVTSLVMAPIAGTLFFAVVDLTNYGFLLAFACWHVLVLVVLLISVPVSARSFANTMPAKAKRYLLAGLTLPVAALLVDDAGAYLLHRYLVSMDGGYVVKEPVTVHGFLDARDEPFWSSGCDRRCVSLVMQARFSFQEYKVSPDRYELLFMADDDDPNCYPHRFGETWAAKTGPVFVGNFRPPAGRCLAYRANTTPTSRYLINERHERGGRLLGWYLVRREERQLVRIDDQAVIASAVYYQVDSGIMGGAIGGTDSWELFLDEVAPAHDSEWPGLEMLLQTPISD